MDYNYTGDAISDKLSRVSSIGDLQDPYARFTYLGADMIVEVDHPAVTGGLALSYGADGTAGLDRFGRVVDQKWTTGETLAVVDEFTYGYDLSGNRTWRDVVPAESPYDVYDETYSYDSLNRLTGLKRGTLESGNIEGSLFAQSWGLDAVGNWDSFTSDPDGDGTEEGLTQDREHDGANQITSMSGGITPAYDAAGNMVSGPKPGSAAGDGQTGQNYTYDAWNRLVKVEEWIWTDANEDGVFQADEKSDLTAVAEYQYDGLNRRIAKLVFDAPSDTWTRTDYYFNENWQVLEERVATAVVAADKGVPATAPKVQYLWDPRYIDTPICRWRDADVEDPDLEETVYYTTDANFNVTALVDGATGEPTERYAYDAYGTVTVLNPDWSAKVLNVSDFDNNILYTGAPLDRETGLILMRRRSYDPSLGVFTSKDPIGLSGGNANLYGYASSNPVVYADPSGLREESSSSCWSLLNPVSWDWVQKTGEAVAQGVQEAAQFVSTATVLASDAKAELLRQAWYAVRHPLTTYGLGLKATGAIATLDEQKLWDISQTFQNAIDTDYSSGGEYVMGAKYLAQGGVNTVNGLQDAAVGVANLPAGIYNLGAWALGSDSRLSYIESPDWSKDLFITEYGSHGISKFIGGESAFTLLTLGVGKLGLVGRGLRALGALKETEAGMGAVRAMAGCAKLVEGAGSASARSLGRLSRFFYDTRRYTSISRVYWKGAANGRALHHWLIPRRATWVPAGIRNAGFNLLEVPSLRGVFHPTLNLNTWMGFARNWSRSSAVQAALAENTIRLGIPVMGGSAAYSAYVIGDEIYSLLAHQE